MKGKVLRVDRQRRGQVRRLCDDTELGSRRQGEETTGAVAREQGGSAIRATLQRWFTRSPARNDASEGKVSRRKLAGARVRRILAWAAGIGVEGW